MDLTKSNGQIEITLQPHDLQRLSEWIHCICVVTFDLELGQAMEVSVIYSFLLKVLHSQFLNLLTGNLSAVS